MISKDNGIKFELSESNVKLFLDVPITLWPLFAKCSAIAVPIPREAPDINTTSSLIIIVVTHH